MSALRVASQVASTAATGARAHPEPLRRWSAAARRARASRAAFTDARLTAVVVVTLVLTQRIGVSIGASQISVGIVIAYAYAAILLFRRRLVVSRLRAELLAVAVAACLVVTTLVDLRGDSYSLNSLLLLVVIYLPWVLRARDGQGAALLHAAGRAFVAVMVVASVVGILQLASQLLGLWNYTDYLASVLPSSIVIDGYNTANELSYGSGTIKANAFVFLEPSILSQFCSLAIMVALVLRLSAWRLLVLAGGLGAAVSGTGLILLVAGGVLLLTRSPDRLRPRYVVAAVVALAALVASPVASVLLSRRDEITEPGSSGYARFVAPYKAAYDGLQAVPIRWLTGAGPGTTSTVLPGSANGLGNDVLYTAPVKLTFEYGLLAGGAFALFLVLANLDGVPWRVVPGCLLVMTLALGGNLLQPETAYLVWLLAGIGASEVAAGHRYQTRTRSPSGTRRRSSAYALLSRRT